MSPTSFPPISLSFNARKTKILDSLSVPAPDYTDLSPKGSVDAAIKPLIEKINDLAGIVTTSSCAGRVSVFLEGNHHASFAAQDGDMDQEASKNVLSSGKNENRVPGGKGRGGRWLFVSHDVVDPSLARSDDEKAITRLLGLQPSSPEIFHLSACDVRLVRFQFEPMILHIMTASLHHAQPVLSAAINAGFRESGIQSLKNLDDTNAFPMVAIRTSGLALESVVGYMDNGRTEQAIQSLVSEGYLALLLRVANERFAANTERTQRFEKNLFEEQRKSQPAWEDADTRRQRKRAEGLNQQRQDIRPDSQNGAFDPLPGEALDTANFELLEGYEEEQTL